MIREGRGKRLPGNDIKKDFHDQLTEAEPDAKQVNLEWIERSKEITKEVFRNFPSFETVKAQVVQFLGTSFDDIATTIIAADFYEGLEDSAIDSIEANNGEKIHPDVVWGYYEDLHQKRGATYRNESEYLSANDLTFYPSDLKYGDDGVMYADKIRRRTQEDRKKHFFDLKDRIKDFKYDPNLVSQSEKINDN